MFLPKNQPFPWRTVVEVCRAHGKHELAAHIQAHPPEKDFVFDGASCFPDTVTLLSPWKQFKRWRAKQKLLSVNTDEATFWHDVRYWSGLLGDEVGRFIADLEM